MGSSPSRPIRKPAGSAAWKHSASLSPGFQPSAAAQSIARSRVLARRGRIFRSSGLSNVMSGLVGVTLVRGLLREFIRE